MGSFSTWHILVLLFAIVIFIALVFLVVFIVRVFSNKSKTKTRSHVSKGKSSEIAALHDLLAKGALSQKEFDQEKKKIL